ncbi:hypothetical protein [Longispora albida]|uniref:hypothetical protein n=1 Tax=Longispora albida TaxID=203523 RepID=UPI00037B263A|nr:hypothetical protein [Longispora albida]
MTPSPAEPDPDSYSSGKVSLSAGIGITLNIESQRSWFTTGVESLSEILVTRNGVSGGNGSVIALVAPEETPNYKTCRNKTTYVGVPLTWDQKSSGMTVCVRTSKNRVGVATIIVTRDRDGEMDRFEVAGTLWKPTA